VNINQNQTIMKKILFLTISLLVIHFASAQNNDYAWKALTSNASSYDSICDAYNNYLRTTYPDSIPKSVIPALKRYHRYKYFWNSRLGLVNGQASYTPYNKALFKQSIVCWNRCRRILP
jgi:hypothetical protein